MIISNIPVIAKSRGIVTPKQLREKTGISRQTCQKILLHNTTDLRLDTIDKLCNVLNCDIQDLLVRSKGTK